MKINSGFIIGFIAATFLVGSAFYAFFQHEKEHFVRDTRHSTTIELRDSFDLHLKSELDNNDKEWFEKAEPFILERIKVAAIAARLEERKANSITIEKLEEKHAEEMQSLLKEKEKVEKDNKQLAEEHEALKMNHEMVKNDLDSINQFLAEVQKSKNHLATEANYLTPKFDDKSKSSEPIKVNQSPRRTGFTPNFDSFLWFLGALVFAIIIGILPLRILFIKLGLISKRKN